jgi:RinA family phage transcriptional activator
MKESEVRYYLHNVDELKLEISDIEADLGQYNAMITDEFILYSTVEAKLQQEKDKDPYPDRPFSPEGKSQITNVFSRTEEIVVKRVDFIKMMEQKIARLKLILMAINNTLYYINDTDKKIIEYRYKQHLKWDAVSKAIPCSEEYARRRDKAIVRQIIAYYFSIGDSFGKMKQG